MTTIKDLTVTAEAMLVDTVPMPSHDRPDREFLPAKIAVKYWPTPDGWRVWSIYINGPSVLKNGELGKSERCAYWSARLGIAGAPAWVQEFVAQHWPGGAR